MNHSDNFLTKWNLDVDSVHMIAWPSAGELNDGMFSVGRMPADTSPRPAPNSTGSTDAWARLVNVEPAQSAASQVEAARAEAAALSQALQQSQERVAQLQRQNSDLAAKVELRDTTLSNIAAVLTRATARSDELRADPATAQYVAPQYEAQILDSLLALLPGEPSREPREPPRPYSH